MTSQAKPAIPPLGSEAPHEAAMELRALVAPERTDFVARIRRLGPRAVSELIAEFTSLLEQQRK